MNFVLSTLILISPSVTLETYPGGGRGKVGVGGGTGKSKNICSHSFSLPQCMYIYLVLTCLYVCIHCPIKDNSDLKKKNKHVKNVKL